MSASLRDIGGGLSAGPDEVAWVQTSYLIAEIIVIPLSGCLVAGDVDAVAVLRLGRRLHLHQLAVRLGLGHPEHDRFPRLAGLSRRFDDPDRLHHRLRLFPGKKNVIAAATIGAIASLAPTLGPTVGGWITDNFSWRWLFFINLVPGVFIAIAVPLMLRIDKPNLSLIRSADYLGIALMAVFLGCLQYALEEGPRWGWFEDETIFAAAWISGPQPASASSCAA